MAVKNATKQKAGVDSVFEYLYLRIYEYFYLTGIRFLRQVRGGYFFVIKQIRHLIHSAERAYINLKKRTYTSLKNFFSGKYHVLLSYKRKADASLEVLRSGSNSSSAEKTSAIIDFAQCWLVFAFKLLCTVLNYLAPVLAAFLLAATVNYFVTLQYGLALVSGGKAIAYISDETVYNEAEQIIRSRSSAEVSDLGNISPSFKIVPVHGSNFTQPEELANVILQNSGANVYEGYGLYIDGSFVGSTDESDNLLLLLDDFREKFRSADDSESRLQFKQKVELIDGVYPTTSIMAISEFNTLLNTEIEGEKYYTVEEGDAPLAIASYFDVSYRELVNMNPQIEDSDIHIGDRLIVSKSVSLLTVTNTKREVYSEEVPYRTEYTYDDTKYTTYSKVTTAGVAGEQEVTALVTYEDGLVVDRQILQTVTTKEPVTRQITRGTKSIIGSVVSGNGGTNSYGFIWPTIGGYVSCGFQGYVGHTGMDISGCGYGSNIYAAASGTVVKVVWSNKGYGNYVIINHGGGIQTLYAHNSNLYVSVGQYVNQGDVIAAMGSTGNSTGNHCHFEVRVNGQYTNPARYF